MLRRPSSDGARTRLRAYDGGGTYCCDPVRIPSKGAIVPVLYQPEQITSLAVPSNADLTLVVLTTEEIPVGVVLRFQTWNGLEYTYDGAVSASALYQFDIAVTRKIPVATLVTVSMSTTSTALYGFTGTATYAAGGPALPAAAFQRFATLLAFAFAPVSGGSTTYVPVAGQPQFAIGFSYKDTASASGLLSGCTLTDLAFVPSAAATAPNIPNQYSTAAAPWTFDVTVVYPAVVLDSATGVCSQVAGIKFQSDTTYALGSWANLRSVISQPFTILQENYASVTNWAPWTVISPAGTQLAGYFQHQSPNMGPFVWSAMPGHLAVVYFRPSPQDMDTDTVPASIPGIPAAAQLGLLVTTEIPANVSIYFTREQFDSRYGGFGAINLGLGFIGTFVTTTPSFVWTTGSSPVPAGTVVFLDNIGGATGDITICNPHDTYTSVGSIVGNTIQGMSVTSIIVTGVWNSPGAVGSNRPLFSSQFVTAALSDEYAGDWPACAPGLTISPSPFSGPAVYTPKLKTLLDSVGLPGTIQAVLVNNGPFTKLTIEEAAAVTPDNAGALLPHFHHLGPLSSVVAV